MTIRFAGKWLCAFILIPMVQLAFTSDACAWGSPKNNWIKTQMKKPRPKPELKHVVMGLPGMGVVAIPKKINVPQKGGGGGNLQVKLALNLRMELKERQRARAEMERKQALERKRASERAKALQMKKAKANVQIPKPPKQSKGPSLIMKFGSFLGGEAISKVGKKLGSGLKSGFTLVKGVANKIDIISPIATAAGYLYEGDKIGATSVAVDGIGCKTSSVLGGLVGGLAGGIGAPVGAFAGEQAWKGSMGDQIKGIENAERIGNDMQKYYSDRMQRPQDRTNLRDIGAEVSHPQPQVGNTGISNQSPNPTGPDIHPNPPR